MNHEWNWMDEGLQAETESAPRWQGLVRIRYLCSICCVVQHTGSSLQFKGSSLLIFSSSSSKSSCFDIMFSRRLTAA